MEDVVMTDVTKEEGLKESKDNTLYQEYRKMIVNLEKAISLKDTKTLYLYSRLLNKFRRGFTDEDCQFLIDNFMRNKFHFNFIPSFDQSQKVIKNF